MQALASANIAGKGVFDQKNQAGLDLSVIPQDRVLEKID